MNIQIAKIELAKRILETDNEQLIIEVENLLNSHENDFWQELNSSQKQEIKQGIEQLKKGKKVSLEEVLSKASL